MNSPSGRLLPALLLRGALLCPVAGIAAADQAGAALLGASPFGPTTAPAAPAGPGLEFRGVVQEGNLWLVNLVEPATLASRWIPVGGEAAGWAVESYDEASGCVTVRQAGRPLVLPLKQARVVALGDNAPLKLLALDGKTPAEAAPAGPEHLRGLPPEARKLLEDARRRRAIRWPAAAAEAPKPPTSP